MRRRSPAIYTIGVFLMLLTKIHWWDTILKFPGIASSLGITFQLQWCFISMEVVQGGESSATRPCLNAYVTQNEWLLADIKVDETNWLQTVCFKSNSRRPSFAILTSANAISTEKINYPCLSIQLTEVIKPTLQTVQGTLTSFNGQACVDTMTPLRKPYHVLQAYTYWGANNQH